MLAAPQVHLYEDEDEEADGIAWHLQQLLLTPSTTAAAAVQAGGDGEPLTELAGALGRLQASDVAVLARTKAQLLVIEKSLKRRGVPCKVRSDGGGGGGGGQSEGAAGAQSAAARPLVRDMVAQLWLLHDQASPADPPTYTHRSLFFCTFGHNRSER